ncbi:MAG TPA: hypothetical protein DEH78_27605 [Solibacterales bacterium]|nr:hypothetical protein [Bryobacterales bacterium]
MSLLFACASAAALATCAIHLAAGGKYVARPLLECRGLRPVPKFTSYYCWHIVTWMLASMAGFYGAAAALPAQWPLALAATILAAGCLVWNVALIGWQRLRPAHFPQWALFSAITAFGILGLWQSR